MARKDDEKVLVVPTRVFEDMYSPLCGVKRAGEGLKSTFGPFLTSWLEFKRRGDVELNAAYLQVIPYCVVFSHSPETLRLLVYNRGSKGGEKRLADQWSIGVGGHINIEDSPPGYLRNRDTGAEHDGFSIVRSAAARELREELGGATPSVLRESGLFYRGDTQVNKVHLGVACWVTVPWGSVETMGDGIVDFKWVMTQESLDDFALEDWSKSVSQYFLRDMWLAAWGSLEKGKK